MIKRIFVKVAMVLYNGAQRLGITYNEINILVYYLLIPLTWTIMVDLLIGAFMRSVDFLNYFNRWGGNYHLNSVVICVAIPIVIYIALAVMLIM